MLNPLDCYAKLKGEADYLLHYSKWIIRHEDRWQDHFGFKAVELDRDAILDEEPILTLVNMYHPIARMGLLRVPPKNFYDWHVDEYRLSCINLLLSEDHHSHTLFGLQKDHLNKDIVELKYAPKRYYLFNNQVQHCVCNLDEDRYLFSIYFQEEMLFKDVRKILKEAELLAEAEDSL